MFEKLETPQEVVHHGLGSALKMENTVLEMLGEPQERSRRKQAAQHVAREQLAQAA